jgi:hypothetical protein
MELVTLAALGIGAGLLGGGLGALSSWMGGESEQDRLRKQKEAAWQQYVIGQRYAGEQYTLQKGEAKNTLAIQQDRLDQSVGMSVDQLNTSLLAQAYGIQDARIQTASQVGASLAAEGMGGTRGNEANGLMRAYAQASLDRNVDLQYRQNDQAVQGMMTQASNNAADIKREQESWDPGGYRYQQQQLQNAYNREMAELGQSNFDWQIGQAAATPLDYMAGSLGGLSSGLNLAGSIFGLMNVTGGGGGTSLTPNAPYGMGDGRPGTGTNSNWSWFY